MSGSRAKHGPNVGAMLGIKILVSSTIEVRMRVLFCWWTFEGYFADCWRALASRSGVEVSIIARRPEAGGVAPHDPTVLRGLDATLYEESELLRVKFWIDEIRSRRPDVVVLPGWVNPACVRAVTSRHLAGVPIVMASDRPWQGTLRQRLGRWRHRAYFRRVDRVIAAGERAATLARHLGIEASKITKGMFGFDMEKLGPCLARRSAGEWPRSFLFVGRYVPMKGVDVLGRAYKEYRAGVANPWSLVCCGVGPRGRALIEAGAEDRGFVQPGEMPGIFAGAGAFVLPSVFEPWGCAMVEAAMAGLPLICTTEVGSGDELAQEANSRIVRPGSVGELVKAMRWMHDRAAKLPAMGERSQQLAASHSCERWAERWEAVLHEAIGRRCGRAGSGATVR